MDRNLNIIKVHFVNNYQNWKLIYLLTQQFHSSVIYSMTILPGGVIKNTLKAAFFAVEKYVHKGITHSYIYFYTGKYTHNSFSCYRKKKSQNYVYLIDVVSKIQLYMKYFWTRLKKSVTRIFLEAVVFGISYFSFYNLLCVLEFLYKHMLL